MSEFFGGPTSEFDDFISTHMEPFMLSAGYVRSGRIFRLSHPAATIVVQAALYTPGPNVSFHIRWGVVPSILREFHSQGKRSWKPTLAKAIYNSTLRPAYKELGDHSIGSFHYTDPRMHNPPEWRLPKWTPQDEFGALFEKQLIVQALPFWAEMLDDDYLYHFYDRVGERYATMFLGLYMGPTGPDWARAIIGVDNGPEAEVAASLQAVASRWPDNPLIPWLTDRFAKRTDPNEGRKED